MGADMAIQFMLMTLFQFVSQMTENPAGAFDLPFGGSAIGANAYVATSR